MYILEAPDRGLPMARQVEQQDVVAKRYQRMGDRQPSRVALQEAWEAKVRSERGSKLAGPPHAMPHTSHV